MWTTVPDTQSFGAVRLLRQRFSGTSNMMGILPVAPHRVTLFWSLPTAILSSAGAAAGIALINSFANLAGFISPYMIGLIKDATQSTNAAMFVLALPVSWWVAKQIS